MPQGYWAPDLIPKQFEVFNAVARFLLVHGPKFSGKTFGILHKVCRHLWDVNGARVAVVSKIVKTARHGGSFDLLIRTTVPEWIASGMGFQLTCGPQTDSVTKTPFFRVRNRHGTESECFLFSLSSEKEVEERFKNTEFSMIYFIELSNFDVRAVFDHTWPSLRMSTVPFDQHQWIADTNPAKEGEDNWIYKLWFQEKADEATLPFLRDNLQDIAFTIDDNTRLDPRQKAALWAAYQYDKDLIDRFYWGKWTRSTADGHFSDVFIPNIHIVGDVSSPKKEEWDVIVPPETCYEFFGGWDLGDIHHSFHLATKRIVNDLTSFDFVDELVLLNQKTSVADFTEMVLEKVEFWEQFMLSEYGRKELKWRHWSDRSAFNYKSAADAEDELTVRNVSEGKIMLMALSGGQLGGSVRTRVSLWKKLLFDKRVFISAQLSFLIGMVRGLRQGPGNEVVQRKTNPLKHSFDSSSYLLIGEAPTDTELNFRSATTKRARVITVAAA